MDRLEDIAPRTPFHSFVCDNCGKALGVHFQFRPDKMADVAAGPNGRKPDGKMYCNRDQLGWASSYHQRELKRTMVAGYSE